MSDEVRYRNDSNIKPRLEEVFEHFGGILPTYRQSHGLKVSCPFHGSDDNPSAVFNEDRQTMHCFTCGMSGDSWSLIMESLGTNYPGAMREAVELGLVDVADDGVTLVGGVESSQPRQQPRKGRRRARKLRRRRR